MNRVYDDRTNETLFKSKDSFECVAYINDQYDENDDDFPHIWIEKVTI